MFKTLLLLCHILCYVYDMLKVSVGKEGIQVYTNDLILNSEIYILTKLFTGQ